MTDARRPLVADVLRVAVADAYRNAARIVRDGLDAGGSEPWANVERVARELEILADEHPLTVEEWWAKAQPALSDAVDVQEALRAKIATIADVPTFAKYLIATLYEIAPMLPIGDTARELLQDALGIVQRDLLTPRGVKGG